MTYPVVSVVIPVRDMEATIGAQLAALAGQDFDRPREVVVADNGSTDASATVAERWRGRLSLRVVVWLRVAQVRASGRLRLRAGADPGQRSVGYTRR